LTQIQAKYYQCLRSNTANHLLF